MHCLRLFFASCMSLCCLMNAGGISAKSAKCCSEVTLVGTWNSRSLGGVNLCQWHVWLALPNRLDVPPMCAVQRGGGRTSKRIAKAKKLPSSAGMRFALTQWCLTGSTSLLEKVSVTRMLHIMHGMGRTQMTCSISHFACHNPPP